MLNACYTISAIFICLLLGHGVFYLIGGIPASLYGMLLLTFGLSRRIIDHNKMTSTIQWLIHNMGVCFVPAAVGIVEYWYLIKIHGLSITFIVITTTLILLALVGYLYQKLLPKPTA